MGGALSIDDFREWDAKRVAQEVAGIGTAFEGYTESFVANGMTGAFILQLQEQDLEAYFEEFHIDKVIHQNRFRAVFKSLVLPDARDTPSPGDGSTSSCSSLHLEIGSLNSSGNASANSSPMNMKRGSVQCSMNGEPTHLQISPRTLAAQNNSKKRTELVNAQAIDTRINSPPRKESLTVREYDVFLSYEWAVDELERNNHDRVNTLSGFLQNNGIVTYTGHERKNERNPMQRTAEAIDHSHVFIVFVTSHYMEKVNGDMKNDHCQRELEYMATLDHVPTHLAIIMEPAMRDRSCWDGMFGLILRRCTTFDLCEDTDFEAKCGEICATVKQLVPRSDFTKRKLSSLQALPQPILPMRDVISQFMHNLHERQGSEAQLHEQLVRVVILAMNRSYKLVCAELNGINIIGSFLINPLASTQFNDFAALALLFLRNIAQYNDINKEAIGKEIPLMTAIVKCLSSNDSEQQHQINLNACEVIRVLGSELRNEKSFVALGAIPSLLILIKIRGDAIMYAWSDEGGGGRDCGGHDPNVRILEASLLALASLMIEREHKVVALENDAVNLLLALLSSPRISIKTKCKVCGALQKLARVNEVAVEIGKRDAIPQIRSLLVETSEHLSHFLQGLVVGLLTRLSYVNENESLLSQPDTIAALVQVLRFAKDDAKSDALLLMRNLSFNEDFSQMIASSVPQMFGILVELMAKGSEKIRVNAGDALSNLCELEANREKAVEAQVLPSLIDLLQRGIHTSNDEEAMAMHDVVTNCIECLVKLADCDTTRPQVRSLGTHLIMLELVQNDGSKNHQAAASRCLEKLALDPEVQLALGANGAMEVFVEALYKGSLVQRESSLGALKNLMLQEANKKLFLDKSGGMKALGMCLQESFLTEKLKVETLQLVYSLIEYELANPCEAGVHRSIKNVMNGSSGSKSPLNLSSSGGRPMLASTKTLRSQRPSPSELAFVQIDFAAVLKNLSESEEYGQETHEVAKRVRSTWNQLELRVQELQSRESTADATARPGSIQESPSV